MSDSLVPSPFQITYTWETSNSVETTLRLWMGKADQALRIKRIKWIERNKSGSSGSSGSSVDQADLAVQNICLNGESG